MVWLLALGKVALAGYGDVAPGDYPNWEEREVHIWTNMVQVDPEEFFGPGNEWGASCGFADFSPDEQTPKLPLYYDYTLNDAGRFHSQDMWENEHFSHSSSDGTSFAERMSRFYFDSGYIGENIAAGYGSSMSAVLYGWMCSAGHRANIMNADYNEPGYGRRRGLLHPGLRRGVVETTSRIAMGNHTPEVPAGVVDFTVDYQGAAGDTVEVVLDGEPIEMFLTYGTESSGIFTVTAMLGEGAGCHEYFFRWDHDGTTGTFPEDGSYLFGSSLRRGRDVDQRPASPPMEPRATSGQMMTTRSPPARTYAPRNPIADPRILGPDLWVNLGASAVTTSPMPVTVSSSPRWNLHDSTADPPRWLLHLLRLRSRKGPPRSIRSRLQPTVRPRLGILRPIRSAHDLSCGEYPTRG